MQAAAFNDLFDETVSGPLASYGFAPHGRRLVADDGLLQLVLARTEMRSQPPARLTLLARHVFLRDRSEQVPTSPPREPADYVIAIAPSELPNIVAGTWTYAVQPLNRTPGDPIDYRVLDRETVATELSRITRNVIDALPLLPQRWSPATLRAALAARGDDAWWIERMWLADYGQPGVPAG